MNEIRKIKHDICHFVGVTGRLVAEGHYIELEHFLSEYEQNTETDHLPVFCENVVANSVM